MKYNWFDVSVPIKSGMIHWPGDPEVEVFRRNSIDEGDEVNISEMTFGLHTGTHMDAPLHFIKGADDITAVSPEVLNGPARVIEIVHNEFIGREELEKKNIKRNERILFKTYNSDEIWYEQDFKKDFIYLNDEGAEYLASVGVSVIGIDYLSIGKFKEGEKTHKTLLSKKIWIIEGLYLSNVPEGEYEMLALPLKIVGADGSPLRVILRTMNKN